MIVKREKGFTLMELMIVIAIIGILTAIAVPNFISYRNRTYCTRAEADANIIALALAEFFADPMNTALPAIETLGLTLSGQPANIGAIAVDDGNPDSDDDDLNDNIIITVRDSSGSCPPDYQNARTEWANGVYTKTISN